MEEEKKVILADGTLIPNCGAGYADGNLWLYPELTMKQAAALFLDESKTAVIFYYRDDEVVTYRGFTVCSLLNAVPSGCRVLMMKGPDLENEEEAEQ